MSLLSEILERYQGETLLTADGFEDAIIGVCEDFNSPPRIIYSVSKCLRILEQDMSEEDAIEMFTFNISGAYVGETTPVWCWDNYD